MKSEPVKRPVLRSIVPFFGTVEWDVVFTANTR